MGKEELVGQPINFTTTRELCGNIMRFGNSVRCTNGNVECPHVSRDPSITPEEWVITIEMVRAVEGCEKVAKN
jgi:hypothetical protein